MIYKGFILKPHDKFPNLTVVATQGQGGSVPKCLMSSFTTTGLATKEIDNYLLTPQEPKRDRKTSTAK